MCENCRGYDPCPKCGYVRIRCEAMDCDADALYNGWYRVVDGFGFKTGLIQRLNVCEVHKGCLIGAQDGQ